MFKVAYTPKHVFRFLLKRLLRLEPPYFLSILLALILLYLREHVLGKTNTHITISANQILLHFGYLIPFFKNYAWLNQVYWTLAIEFQFYVLMAFLFLPLVMKKKWLRVCIYILIMLGSLYFTNIIIFYWLPSFLFGILVFLYLSKEIGAIEYYTSSLVLLIFCCLKLPWFSLVFTLIPIVMILFMTDKKIKLLDFIGKFSYSIYLIHPIIGASFINVFLPYFQTPLLKCILIGLGLLVTFIGAGLSYMLVEKPSKKLSASITYP